MELYNMVFVYDEDGADGNSAGYCTLAHNLMPYEGKQLRDRMAKQYDLAAFAVSHSVRHDDGEAPDCKMCALLVERLAENVNQALVGREHNPDEPTEVQ